MTEPLLVVENLSVFAGPKRLVTDVSFEITADSRVGLIGESGSGKSLTALAIIGLLADGLRAEGSVRLHGRQLLGLGESKLVGVRGKDMSMIFQEPMTALNPLHRVGRQVAEPLRLHHGLGASEAHRRAVEMLERVGIDDVERRANAYPHELSGGQRQRVMIATALACSPDLVIADEPTTALDVTVQQQVLNLLTDVAEENHAALLLITHDLPVVSNATEDVMVLRDGELLERGPTAEVFATPSHVYTRMLVASVPPLARGELVGSSASVSKAPDMSSVSGASDTAMVTISNVSKRYALRRRRLFDERPTLTALDDVSLNIRRGETFGVVGESGSGKSTLARAIVGLTRPDTGDIMVDGIAVGSAEGLKRLRPVAQMIFQDPNGSLDPRLTVGRIVAEPLRALGIAGDYAARVAELLDAVRLGADVVGRYPHEFSGGQRQRIAIARALAPNPSLVVADEAVSALDMSVQTVTLDLLASLKERFNLTMIFISHDLSVIAEICERVAVLDRGQVVEVGDATQVLQSPTHPYTQRLISAIPRMWV